MHKHACQTCSGYVRSGPVKRVCTRAFALSPPCAQHRVPSRRMIEIHPRNRFQSAVMISLFYLTCVHGAPCKEEWGDSSIDYWGNALGNCKGVNWETFGTMIGWVPTAHIAARTLYDPSRRWSALVQVLVILLSLMLRLVWIRGADFHDKIPSISRFVGTAYEHPRSPGFMTLMLSLNVLVSLAAVTHASIPCSLVSSSSALSRWYSGCTVPTTTRHLPEP